MSRRLPTRHYCRRFWWNAGADVPVAWKNQSRKLLAVMGIAGAVTMVLMSASSTPVLALLAGSIGLVLWPLRARMRSIRWGIVLSLVVLALVMKAPVWFVIAHVDLVGGSSGYQRALLVDQFIRHFSDWWLLGAPNNGDWGWDMWDVQNQFVAEGEVGGDRKSTRLNS